MDPWAGEIPWRRERLPTPVFWPEELHGLYSPWGRKESDTTEQLSLSLLFLFFSLSLLGKRGLKTAKFNELHVLNCYEEVSKT